MFAAGLAAGCGGTNPAGTESAGETTGEATGEATGPAPTTGSGGPVSTDSSTGGPEPTSAGPGGETGATTLDPGTGPDPTSAGATTEDPSTGATTAEASTGPGETTGPDETTGSVGTYTPGYLHTEGAKIVDHTGQTVRLTGINWFGFETTNYAPHGLWARPMSAMFEQISELGYNTVRVPFASQLLDPGIQTSGVDYAQNPDLQGKHGLALLDAFVAGAKEHGLKVILDRHRPGADGQSELWYTDAYPESRWISDFEMLAAHYKGDTTVIGFDLHNEPHGPATWGSGNMATDWDAAAERAGDAILAVNPELLILVEGVEVHEGQYYWWGGNLRGAKQHPVELAVPNQLVYSPHDYPKSVYAQPWFSDPQYPANLEEVWRDTWGYLVEEDLAPVLIGEFGTKYEDPSDHAWMDAHAAYITAQGLSFTFWCLNPNSIDTGGLLLDDWTTVHAGKQAALSELLAPKLP